MLARRSRGAEGAYDLSGGWHPQLCDARRSGARFRDAGGLPPQPDPADGGASHRWPCHAGRQRPRHRRSAFTGPAGAGRGPRHAHRARSQDRAGGLRHSRGAHAKREHGAIRGRRRCASHRIPGRAEDPLDRHLAQVRSRRRGPRPRQRGRCGRRCANDACAHSPQPTQRADRWLHRAGHGAAQPCARADRRRQHRQRVRAGDPVRARRHLGRSGRRPGRGLAAAQHGPGTRTRRAHARGQAAQRLSGHAGGRSRRALCGAGRGVGVAGRCAGDRRTRHQPR